MSDFMKCTAYLSYCPRWRIFKCLGITFTSDGSMEHEVAGQVAAKNCHKQSEQSHRGGSWIRSLITVNLCSNVHLRSWALRIKLKNEIVQDCCGRRWGNHTSRELWAVPLCWKDPTDVVLGSDWNASAIKLARQIRHGGTPLLMNFKGLRCISLLAESIWGGGGHFRSFMFRYLFA